MRQIISVAIICLTILEAKAQLYSLNGPSNSSVWEYSDNKSHLPVHRFKYESIAKSIQNEKSTKFFIAYELGEAVFNKFQSLSGEIGIRFENQQMLRLVHINLTLTEEHLSSGFAGAVDGENVTGKQFGFETFYDFPILFKGFMISPSMGYYKNEYQHTVLSESIENSSFSLGAALSFRETDIFNLKGLYYSVSIPMRIHVNPIQETSLGETIITNNTFDNNIWFFIGFEF